MLVHPLFVPAVPLLGLFSGGMPPGISPLTPDVPLPVTPEAAMPADDEARVSLLP
jgi:hypothetical protein